MSRAAAPQAAPQAQVQAAPEVQAEEESSVETVFHRNGLKNDDHFVDEMHQSSPRYAPIN